jgi:hypothetical protein
MARQLGGSGQLISTNMVNGGLVALDPANRAFSLVDGLSTQDFASAAVHISATDGTLTVPTQS